MKPSALITFLTLGVAAVAVYAAVQGGFVDWARWNVPWVNKLDPPEVASGPSDPMMPPEISLFPVSDSGVLDPILNPVRALPTLATQHVLTGNGLTHVVITEG